MIVWALVSVLFAQQQAYANPVLALAPVFEGVINRVVGKAIVMNLSERGVIYAANDAAFARTMTLVGQAANDATWASAAVTTVAAVAGAPVWLSTALGVGAIAAVGAIAWGAYQLTQNSDVSTLPNGSPSPKSLTLTPTTSTPPPQPIGNGSWSSYTSPLCNPAITTTCGMNAQLPNSLPYYTQGYPNSGTVIGCVSALDCVTQRAAAEAHFQSSAVINLNYAIAPNPVSPCLAEPCSYRITVTWDPLPGSTVSGEVIDVYPTTNSSYVPSPTTRTGTLNDIAGAITPDMLNQPLPDALLAQIANRLWQIAASNPGYNGLPYSATNPITANDISSIRSQNPDITPKWNDLVNTTPSAPSYPTVPISPDPIPVTPTNPSPVPNPNPSPVPNPSNNTQVNLGPDPGIGQPALEAIPSASDILKPLLDLFPDLRNFSMPGHSGECPRPTFDVFGKSIQMNSQCDLAEQNRAVIFSIMTVTWLVIALFIVLSA
ncbi:hypothetical protein [Jeongeupia chitinilytica]|uniref:hypothetical protein n=1 Tax=Jeongeupia chitinilytica TaxID=1041641 RepID=UPI001679438F|nr:hypothetical protein [Jeongeupia chitinilytica]